MLQAILAGHKYIVEIVDLIEELREKAGLGKKDLPPAAAPQPADRGVPQASSAPSSASASRRRAKPTAPPPSTS